MPPKKIDSTRRLALQLYALHESDRTWILSQITSEARASLEPMLQELDSLGFRVDPEILDSITNDMGSSVAPADGIKQQIEILREVNSEWLRNQLRGEPRSVVDCVVTAYPWPWLTEIHAPNKPGMPPINHGDPYSGPTRRVRQALLDALVERMNDDTGINDALHLLPDAPNQASEMGKRPGTTRFWRWRPWKR